MAILSYLIALFEQDLVIFTQSHAENDGSYILKAMNPFLSFTPLATHIKHAIHQSAIGNDGSY